jgi:hypothetical protein
MQLFLLHIFFRSADPNGYKLLGFQDWIQSHNVLAIGIEKVSFCIHVLCIGFLWKLLVPLFTQIYFFLFIAVLLERIWTRTTLTKYYIINYKCISGLPSFLWPRFPLTHNKPVVGHASTVITSEVGEGSGRTGTCKPHDSRTSFGGSWG